jgi:hypothetical protein
MLLVYKRWSVIILGTALIYCIAINGRAFVSEKYTMDEIAAAALMASSLYNPTRAEYENEPEYEIPSRCWNDIIRSLKPVKVYNHRLNVVIAISIKNGIEEGIYIFNVVSSYRPLRYDEEVENGFTFTRTNGKVCNYRRRIKEK